MSQLPLERHKELMDLYGDTRKCAVDELYVRQIRYKEAIANAARDFGAVTTGELDSAIRAQWHRANKTLPLSVKGVS